MRSLRSKSMIIAAIGLGLGLGLTGPAFSDGVSHALFAHNSDKVDGKHAVGGAATLGQAAGKLVSHGSNGKLPAKFIPKVEAAKTSDNTLKVNGLSATTITGKYYVMGPATGAGQYLGEGISFDFMLPATPTSFFVAQGATPPAQCPGTAAEPKATPGALCVYEGGNQNVTDFRGVDQLSRSGSGIFIQSAAAGHTYSFGSWAVKPAIGSSRVAPQAGSAHSPTD